MQMGSHEAHDLNELLMSCVNTITNMSFFLSQVKDQELKAIITRQFPVHIRDYNMKVDFARSTMGPGVSLPVPRLGNQLGNIGQFQAGNYPSLTPSLEVTHFDDSEIATAYLLTLKRSGKDYAWAAFETTHPQMRHFLEDAFTMCSHHAYEVWQWMVSRGLYPVDMASTRFMQTMGQMYQPIPENQEMWNQSQQLYQNAPNMHQPFMPQQSAMNRPGHLEQQNVMKQQTMHQPMMMQQNPQQQHSRAVQESQMPQYS